MTLQRSEKISIEQARTVVQKTLDCQGLDKLARYMGVSLERIIECNFETLIEIKYFARDTATSSKRDRPKITMTEASCSTGVEWDPKPPSLVLVWPGTGRWFAEMQATAAVIMKKRRFRHFERRRR